MKRSSNSERFEKSSKYSSTKPRAQQQYGILQPTTYFASQPVQLFRTPPLSVTQVSGPLLYNPNVLSTTNLGHLWNYSVPPPPFPPIRPLDEPISPPTVHQQQHAQTNLSSGKAIAKNTERDSQSTAKKTAKRKTMSARYGGSFKDWDREDAIKALALENECLKKTAKAPILLLRFPDPELNRSIVSGYSQNIDTVHFQLNSAPRNCFVHLHPDANVEETIAAISKVPFGTGFVSAELRRVAVEGPNADTNNPDDIDPYTLYIGNLTHSISTRTVKDHFPGAMRVDVGFAQRMKGTRYAFIRYDCVEKSMEGFRNMVNKLIESRSLVVRFLRKKHPLPLVGRDTNVTRSDKEDRSAFELRHTKRNKVIDCGASVLKERSSANSILESSIDLGASAEDFARVECDSKEDVLIEVEKIVKEKQPQLLSLHNCDAANLNEDRSLQTKDCSPSVDSCYAAANIKKEIFASENITEDDLSEDENLPSNSMLGARYNSTEKEIKKEPQMHTPLRDELDISNLEYDEEFGNDSDHAEEYDRLVTFVKRSSETGTSLATSPERKPSLEQLNRSINSNCCPTEHSFFVKNLYNEVRRAKATEKGKRPRDDLDELFAQLNSDDENYSEDNFY